MTGLYPWYPEYIMKGFEPCQYPQFPVTLAFLDFCCIVATCGYRMNILIRISRHLFLLISRYPWVQVYGGLVCHFITFFYTSMWGGSGYLDASFVIHNFLLTVLLPSDLLPPIDLKSTPHFLGSLNVRFSMGHFDI